MSELFEIVGLPHLSGYLVAGIVSGPYVLNLIDHQTVKQLTNVNSLALALIALEGGGASFRLSALREGMRAPRLGDVHADGADRRSWSAPSSSSRGR